MSEEDEQKLREAQQAEKEFREAKEVMDAIGHYVNYRKNPKAFIEAFKREHRTLQQSAFRLILELIEEVASDNYRTDGRNEASQAIAKKLLAGFAAETKKQYIAEGTSEERAEKYVQGDGAKPSRYLPFI